MSEELDQDDSSGKTTSIDRGALIRDAVVFQVKLAIDGLIDLVMIPVSFVAAVISFIKGSDSFYEAMRSGRRLDRKLNLYGAARNMRAGGDDQIEVVAQRIEDEIRRGLKDGKLQTSVRAAIDKALAGFRDSKS